jgi:hypothetical protein
MHPASMAEIVCEWVLPADRATRLSARSTSTKGLVRSGALLTYLPAEVDAVKLADVDLVRSIIEPHFPFLTPLLQSERPAVASHMRPCLASRWR